MRSVFGPAHRARRHTPAGSLTYAQATPPARFQIARPDWNTPTSADSHTSLSINLGEERERFFTFRINKTFQNFTLMWMQRWCYRSVGAAGVAMERRLRYSPVSGFVAIRVKSVEPASSWHALTCCSNTHSAPWERDREREAKNKNMSSVAADQKLYNSVVCVLHNPVGVA